MTKDKVKIALLDLYNNEPNLGIGNIQEILHDFDRRVHNIPVEYKIYNVRAKEEIPPIDAADIFISSGGPGSPYEGVNMQWEKKYFNLIEDAWNYNSNNENKKHVFFICHSFQMMARFFKVAEVKERHSRSFGIFPVNKTESGKHDFILNQLPEPFYAADFRSWQVLHPDEKIMNELGAEVICIEKERPHVEYERAVMGIKIGDEFYGVQFHPEADPEGMKYHYRQEKRKQKIIDDVGEKKYDFIMEQLEDPEKVAVTYKTVLPVFLESAILSVEEKRK